MKHLITISIASLLALASIGCTVEQTEEGELPDVKVEGGNMPEFDVDAADVDVEMKEKTIKVPDIDVDMPDDDGEELREDMEESAEDADVPDRS